MHRVLSITTSHFFLLEILLLMMLVGCAPADPQDESTTPPAVEEDVASVVEEDDGGEEAPAGNPNLAKMQGKWQSNDDAKAVVEITGSEFASWYDGELADTGALAFVKDCEATSEDSESEYFTVSVESDDPMCYYLLAVDESSLEYSYVGRGNTLSYTRVTE